MHLNSKLLFAQYAKPYFIRGMRVLEIGADPDGTYRKIVDDPGTTWETLELAERPDVTHVATDEYHFPVPNDAFDIVLSGQVIEHVRKVWVWIRELARVCKPRGKVITINPVSWPYHEAPVDCWRIYPEGMRTLYGEADLKVDLCRCESLESGDHRSLRMVPGATSLPMNLRNPGSIARRLLGFPVSYAIDTITIGTKPD